MQSGMFTFISKSVGGKLSVKLSGFALVTEHV